MDMTMLRYGYGTRGTMEMKNHASVQNDVHEEIVKHVEVDVQDDMDVIGELHDKPLVGKSVADEVGVVKVLENCCNRTS